MNFRLVLNMLGKILLIMAALMLLPAVVSVCSGGTIFWQFLLPQR